MITNFRRKRGQKGFTLIEWMIVVDIIGILAAIAIPNFLMYQCKSRQAEAKANLGAIFTNEEAYRAEYDLYNTGLSANLGWAAAGTTRYAYTISAASSTAFTARASGDIDGDGTNDAWTMDNTRNLTNATNDCT